MGFVESDIRERMLEGSFGVDDKVSAEILLVTRSTGAWESLGTSMPRFSAVTRN